MIKYKSYAEEMAEEAAEKAHKKGVLYGRKEGMEKGIEKGMQETAHEIVLKMLDKGLNTKAISSYTGLSEKNIKSIKSKPKNGPSNRN